MATTQQLQLRSETHLTTTGPVLPSFEGRVLWNFYQALKEGCYKITSQPYCTEEGKRSSRNCGMTLHLSVKVWQNFSKLSTKAKLLKMGCIHWNCLEIKEGKYFGLSLLSAHFRLTRAVSYSDTLAFPARCGLITTVPEEGCFTLQGPFQSAAQFT